MTVPAAGFESQIRANLIEEGSMKTAAELNAQIEKLDAMLAADVLSMADQTFLEASRDALLWAAGTMTDSPVERAV